RFFSAYKHEASLKNENITMVLETEYGDIIVRQVAGFLARRAVCRVKEGEFLKRGDRFGIIKFSSRVDLYLPTNTLIMVEKGDKVRAGETIIGEVKG
ncbi:MAG: phosphatidylserine decarboxylase, partial [Thermodesulfovibrionales bacterium]